MFPHFVSCVLADFLQLRGESRFICGYLCGDFFHVCSIYAVCSFTMCNSQRNWLFTVKTAAHNLLYQFCSKVSQQHHYLQNSTLHFLVFSRLLLELLVCFGSLLLFQGIFFKVQLTSVETQSLLRSTSPLQAILVYSSRWPQFNTN